VNLLNKQSRIADKGLFSNLGLGVELTYPRRKIPAFCETLQTVLELAGCCEYGNEPSDSIKRGEFVDKLIDYQLLKKNYGSCSELVRLGRCGLDSSGLGYGPVVDSC
jgi:hypothetical protein